MWCSVVYCLWFAVAITRASNLENVRRILNATEVTVPTFDVGNKNNQFQILDDINGISFYEYLGQQNFTTDANVTDVQRLIYYSNETFMSLSDSIAAEAQIQGIIPLGDDSFILSGQGMINNVSLASQLVFNMTDLSITKIFDTPLRSIEGVTVDGPLVYFMGNFTFNNNTGAIMWDSRDRSINLLPFHGFGPYANINSILKLNDDNILFAGHFSTVWNSSLLLQSNVSEESVRNTTSLLLNPSVPLQYSQWKTNGELDSSQLICPDPSKDSWSVSATTGDFTCELPFQITPSKIRIYNSPDKDSQVSLFRFLTYPAGSIMNLTYLDPLSGNMTSCDAFCPLYSKTVLQSQWDNTAEANTVAIINNNSTNIQWTPNYQEFALVSPVAATSLEFNALASYGNNLGLAGFQIYQASFSAFGNNSFNTPNCNNNDKDSNNTFTSSSLSPNNWTSVGEYLTVGYTPNENPVPKVTYKIDIQHSGEYSINVFTPGCSADNTCSTRGIVNYTLFDTVTNKMLATSLIYQNNDEIKYDTLYSGQLNSSCEITMTYYSGLYASNTVTTIVADRVDLNIISMDLSHRTEVSKLALNGLFQYQISNFTNDSIPMKIANTSLNQFALNNFEPSVSLRAFPLSNSSILLSGTEGNMFSINLNTDLSVQNSTRLISTENFTTFQPYSNGLVMLDGQGNVSLFKDNFKNLNTTMDGSLATDVANITLNGDELLVFNNGYIYNVTSQQQTRSNSSIFNLTVSSAGANSINDTIFLGKVVQWQYAIANQSAQVNADFNDGIEQMSLPSNTVPSRGIFLNDDSTGYFYKESNKSKLYITNSNSTSGLEWYGEPETVVYDKNDTLLMVGYYNDNTFSSTLSLTNLTSFDVIKEENLNVGSSISSLLYFAKNDTLLVAGDFEPSNGNCSDLCLYNYKSGQWDSLANNSVSGSVAALQLYQNDTILVLGNLTLPQANDVNMAFVNLSNNHVGSLIMKKDAPVNLHSMIVSNSRIVAWNDTVLFSFDGNSWTRVSVPGTDSSATSISSVQFISMEGTDDALLLLGEFRHSEFGDIKSIVYNFRDWIPYLLYVDGPRQGTGHLFMNRDISLHNIAQIPLLNSTRVLTNQSFASSTSSSVSSTSTTLPKVSTTHSKPGRRIVDRGFVVLIGLALALATVSVMGVAGVLLAYIFRDNVGDSYQTLNPRMDENAMVNTLPPEKLKNAT
ncbi:Rax2p KNAG_0G02000 [Huiozyma naganishii CBS 8797]|uniref:Bud site selection protein RAX2 n=1 Tax=Huiozyma naganishii (strain ATCC MYA-139 / BCRC 22969 / CBS 8797 / KCTC 17520 / NBRC 10181 / NCYC 3082 / Yp74L-3) TaxID=1071383 RepID=J7S114_HUIN7|nr:hypothetical protein KNAG_0G02000 [Kazachstania naganishii CBS 8797]CCK71257.1 hypothetical protein KNAG_0G02000 [Kazachstania naganishii CBS 8797]